MSLSKVFKDSRGFKPEEILPRPAGGLSDRTGQPFKESPVGRKRSSDQGFALDRHLASPPDSPRPPRAEETPAPDDVAAADAGLTDGERESLEPEDEELQGIDPFTVERMVEESFQRGVDEGLRRAEADFGSALQTLLALCRQLDNLRETILTNSIGEMQDLVIAIAEKIVRISVREQDATIVETVDEAIHSAVRSDEFYVYVHPEDFAVIQAKSPDFIAGLNGLNNLVIKKDPAMERGGCKVESENCTVDATITSQFEIIREQIKKRLKQV